MSFIQTCKTQKLAQSNQLILLNEEGIVIDSCDSIFSTHRNRPVRLWFPLMESIFDSILRIGHSEPDLTLTQIENPSALLPGFYDFIFSNIQFNQEPCILWIIQDHSAFYSRLKFIQQRRNELEIQLEKLEGELAKLGTEKLKLEKENQQLLQLQNIQISNERKVQKELKTSLENINQFSENLRQILPSEKIKPYADQLESSKQTLAKVILELNELFSHKETLGLLYPNRNGDTQNLID